MGANVSAERLIYQECSDEVEKGKCTWKTLPGNLQSQFDQIVLKLERGVDALNVDALFELASLLADGKGVVQDEQRAVELWKNASDLDHIPSRFKLGEMYYTSRGIPPVKNGVSSGNERSSHVVYHGFLDCACTVCLHGKVPNAYGSSLSYLLSAICFLQQLNTVHRRMDQDRILQRVPRGGALEVLLGR